VIPLDSQEMGERAVCRLITKSIRLLTNHSSTIALCGVPGPRAIGKEPRLHVLEFLRALSFFPHTSLVTLFGTPRYPSLTALAHPRSAHSYIEWPAGQQQP